MLENESAAHLADMKARLLQQQVILKTAMRRMVEKIKENREDATEASASAETTGASSVETAAELLVADKDKLMRTCPMCEAAFNRDVGQDAFEAHVVEHFSYEESETLRNFDLVPDAQF